MASQDQNTGTTHVELQGGENSKKLFSKYDLWSKAMDEKKLSSSLFTVNDTQEFLELCEACRRGDLEVVKSLVENYNTPINQVDQFDYSPLVLASLCGHEPVVKFLLENGALCERDTFQGERCLYGALNDNIRRMLLSYDITKAIDESQPYASHITSLLSNSALHFTTDIVFAGQYGRVFAHKFYLAARSSYFKSKFSKLGPSEHEIEVKHFAKEFESILRYLYLDTNAVFTKQYNNALLSIGKKFQLNDFIALYEKDREQLHSRDWKKIQLAKTQNDLGEFLDYIISNYKVPIESLNQPSDQYSFHDAYLQSYTHRYPVHRAIMCRCEYFLDMLAGPFLESNQELPVLSLPFSSSVVEIVLKFLYTDKTDIAPELALDVVYVADMLSLDKDRSLKSLASIVITKQEEPIDSIYDILRTAWDTSTPRLEQYASEYMANHLEHLIDDPEFCELVKESADRILQRQETDTIELIDDIRYFLSKRFGIYHEDLCIDGVVDTLTPYESEYNQKMEMIDDLLDKLELQA
ncbi:BTB/POZ family substrate adaptor for cullin 3 ubiquitin ligase Btb3 [Schizosaccharomyces pombe]|uniref:BTB/POZ domain-containing protein 3 n=1 Tax=Schizosaccharomyces pombe (strain 972 / ATCC 24843) TaxID=284812 RepID=BTB3_SCHPO|nr:ubiquitin ligase Btb3 [Schizosaccharomyces pombe]Q10225.1 RecName: Full=BTB/POZ domain-containing protein 3 [Schizosaccharomyces pombe 972h-]CAA93544.1 substrate adaptor for cullin 3 ubiquitin ligase Btb3 [Schizosaccharomyces pombe]|eukprot:NP_593682.1 ubiquitin ligase Btb3 [Schizosaccharomyces pombe]